jgi:hypothetical protein
MARKIGFSAAAAALLIVAAVSAFPQAGRPHDYGRLWNDLDANRQPPPGTEFIFARVKFTDGGPGRGPGNYLREIPGWAHDYPDSEEHILQIASEVTGINLTRDSYVIVHLESDEIFRYPFLYFSEIGEMQLNEKEIANLREFFNRGGFAIADDFDEPSLNWFIGQMQKVFPNRPFSPMSIEHSVFNAYYDIPTLDINPPYAQIGGKPRFLGYYDERGRLLMVLNVNNDFGDYWEWIDQPDQPLAVSTEALRFGINYLVYSLTH